MIHEVDEVIQTLMRDARVGGSGVEVAFDAPTKDWSARRTSPTLNFYLYDVREELARRVVGRHAERDEDGHIVAWRTPPRYFRLAYLVTAWTERPEDGHRLLAGVLGYFAGVKGLSPELFNGSIKDLGLPCFVNIGRPPAEDRQVPEVWSALGGELKPSLDLVITVPMEAESAMAAAGLVRSPLVVRTMDSSSGAAEEVQARRLAEDGQETARAGLERMAATPAPAGTPATTSGSPGSGRPAERPAASRQRRGRR